MVKTPERSTGTWKVEDCEEKRGFVCKRNIGKWTKLQQKLSAYVKLNITKTILLDV